MTDFKPDTQFPINVSMLPPSWAVFAVGEVIPDIRQGFSSGEHNEDGTGIPHLRPMNIDRRGRIVLKQLKYVAPTTNDLRITRGDVLFNNTNSADLVGKTAVFDLDGQWGFSNHMTRLRPPTGVLPRFIAYQLHYLWQDGYFRLRRTQHVNQASISLRTLSSSIPFVLAPTVDQEAIVAELERIFERLDQVEVALDRAMCRLGQYIRDVVVSAAEGVLLATEAWLAQRSGQAFENGAELLARLLHDHRDAQADMLGRSELLAAEQEGSTSSRGQSAPQLDFELPDGWAVARVDEVGEVTLGRQRAPQHHQGPHMRPYLRVANVFEDRIDTSDVRSMNFTPREFEIYALRRGDILLNEGQSPELVGRSAMYRDELPGACFQKTLIRFRAKPGMSPTFALLVFRAYLHTGRFRQASRWSTNIAHLTRERFAAMPFPLPPLAEQERIVVEAERRLDAADAISELVRSIAHRVVSARHVVLREAFSGRLVPSIAPAGAVLQLIRRIQEHGTTDDNSKERHFMPRRPSRRKNVRRPLVEVLTELGAPTSPEDLLEQSGIGEDLIDEFFMELRDEIFARRIREDRDLEGNILLVSTLSVA
jgi:type I restriction enzyme S subunit